jgi:hypothetical protein
VRVSEGSVCTPDTLPVLLAAYTASMSRLDRRLLEVCTVRPMLTRSVSARQVIDMAAPQLLHEYERSGVPLADYAWAWGPASIRERGAREGTAHIGMPQRSPGLRSQGGGAFVLMIMVLSMAATQAPRRG